MGTKVAFERPTLCDNMLPGRAYELGLVNRVVPGEKLLDEALELAHGVSVMMGRFPA